MSLTVIQKENRKRGVGCSEILAALGKDDRTSRLELYMRKVGELPEPDFSDDERVECGTYLEPSIRTLFERKLGAPIVKYPETLFHPDAPLVGHPDGVVAGEIEAFADKPGIEFKNRDRFIFIEEYGEDGTDQVPLRDLVQCTGYMLLTGKRRWLLGALVGGNERHVFEIPFDETLAGGILAGVRSFWEHVVTRKPPDPLTPDEVKLRWPRDLGTSIVATDEIIAECVGLAEAKDALKAAEENESAFKTRIQRFMGEHAILENPAGGKPLATWKTARDSQKFDEAQFAIDEPDLYRRYLTSKPGSRRFLLKK